MAGLLASQGMSPEEVYQQPYFRDSNPIMDMLVKLYQQTEGVAKRGERFEGRRLPEKNKARTVKGPIQAKTAKDAANRRDRILRQIE